MYACTYVSTHTQTHTTHTHTHMRWVHHGPEFRSREAAWPEFRAALGWERQNLPRLIRSARLGTELRVRADDLALPKELSDERASLRQHELPF